MKRNSMDMFISMESHVTTRQAVIQNTQGIHARPSGVIMTRVDKYDGEIYLIGNGMEFPLENIMDLLAMGLCKDDTVTMNVSGDDEAAFADELAALFETHFDFPPR